MLLGYNTNGFAHHDLFEAIELLAERGYRGVAITIDHGALPPDSRHHEWWIGRLREILERLDMRSVIETGARFLLDPRKKHEPTLVSADSGPRVEFYEHAIDCAAALGSDCVSLWSGVLHDSISRQQAMDRLTAGLRPVLDYARGRGVVVGFEPEPAMLIDSMDRFSELLERIDVPNLGLTLDIGHLHCQGETPIDQLIRHWGPRIVNVHIEDMRRGMHEHLMFGEGEIQFAPVLKALAGSGYDGGVYVELSRHGHEAPSAARRAFEFLDPLMKNV
jgi:L-ribulose-5-phosphate 3-epimerase